MELQTCAMNIRMLACRNKNKMTASSSISAWVMLYIHEIPTENPACQRHAKSEQMYLLPITNPCVGFRLTSYLGQCSDWLLKVSFYLFECFCQCLMLPSCLFKGGSCLFIGRWLKIQTFYYVFETHFKAFLNGRWILIKINCLTTGLVMLQIRAY